MAYYAHQIFSIALAGTAFKKESDMSFTVSLYLEEIVLSGQQTQSTNNRSFTVAEHTADAIIIWVTSTHHLNSMKTCY